MNPAFRIDQSDIELTLQLARHVRPHHTVKDEKLRRVGLDSSTIGEHRIDHASDAAAHDSSSKAMLSADRLHAVRNVLIWTNARRHHPRPTARGGTAGRNRVEEREVGLRIEISAQRNLRKTPSLNLGRRSDEGLIGDRMTAATGSVRFEPDPVAVEKGLSITAADRNIGDLD